MGFFTRVISLVYFIAGISLLLLYENKLELFLKSLELEIIWRYLVNFGPLF